jgi:hypothetical protein
MNYLSFVSNHVENDSCLSGAYFLYMQMKYNTRVTKHFFVIAQLSRTLKNKKNEKRKLTGTFCFL